MPWTVVGCVAGARAFIVKAREGLFPSGVLAWRPGPGLMVRCLGTMVYELGIRGSRDLGAFLVLDLAPSLQGFGAEGMRAAVWYAAAARAAIAP